MKIELQRTYNNGIYCIGHLYINGVYYCDTIEDTDRGLTSDMPLDKIKKIKVYSCTAIPAGTYTVTLSVLSAKFYQKSYYRNFCKGMMPRLLNVPGFEGILIHRGINQNSSAGCLIVGWNKIKGQVVDSQKAFEGLYKKMKQASDKGEKITITIVQKWKK